VLCYSIEDKDSFENLSKWIEDIHQTVPKKEDEEVLKIIVGNKSDL
jgi:GTPase SAR1 family protein